MRESQARDRIACSASTYEATRKTHNNTAGAPAYRALRFCLEVRQGIECNSLKCPAKREKKESPASYFGLRENQSWLISSLQLTKPTNETASFA